MIRLIGTRGEGSDKVRKLKKLVNLGFWLSACILAGALQAQAQTNNTTANLDISLEIAAGCSIGFGSGTAGDAGTVNFGSFINLDSDQSAEIDLSVRCSRGSNISYNIGLSEGKNATDGTYKTRSLAATVNGTTRLISYNIYKDSAHTQYWGPAGSSDVLGPMSYPDADIDTHTVYLLVPAKAGEALYPGVYTDTVVATVTWE